MDVDFQVKRYFNSNTNLGECRISVDQCSLFAGDRNFVDSLKKSFVVLRCPYIVHTLNQKCWRQVKRSNWCFTGIFYLWLGNKKVILVVSYTTADINFEQIKWFSSKCSLIPPK